MNRQIYEEATDWLVKNREGELHPQEKRAFDTWLRASSQHVRAYLEMSAVWEEVPALEASWNPTPEDLIARARNAENVCLLRNSTGLAEIRDASDEPSVKRPADTQDVGRGWGRGHRLLAFAATILCCAVGLSTWYWVSKSTYTTSVGEQRSIVLADGSTVELNSISSVRVRYTGAQRRVDLLEGQALFRVAHDTARPFVVHSGKTNVRAVGTEFDVYRKRIGTVVTVIEGKVAVLAATRRATETGQTGSAVDAGPSIFLAAGEQLTVPVAPTGEIPVIESPQPANVAAATAWTHRALVFEVAPLTEVVEEFNRYNARKLVIADPAVADIHVSGMFSSLDPALLLKFLDTQPEIAVEETKTEVRIHKR